MPVKNFLASSILVLLLVAPGDFELSQKAVSKELRKKYEGYGEDWIFMPDGDGKPQVAILKADIPESRAWFDEIPVTYVLFTRDGPKNGTKIKTGETEVLKKSGFSPIRQSKFITHGWKSSAFTSSFKDMKDAYLSQDDYNVFLVDWEPLAASTFYLGPMANTGKVGQDAAKFIDFVVRDGGLKTKDVHFIGHSLGAHVAGNAGHHTTSGPLGRVTGLDPALPGVHMFSSLDSRLDPSDANFVDIIHSCGGVLGYFQPLGHADYYPNGGTAVQPGCCCFLELLESCSHGRSHEYFTESIISKSGFPATKCSDWDNFIGKKCSDYDVSYMGEHCDKSRNGTYFLKTRSEKPYAYVAEIEGNDI